MAFLKKADAGVVHQNFTATNWQNFISQNRDHLANGPYRTASTTPNLVAQASEILQEQFDPSNYLLTHATIVASVDTEDVANARMGNDLDMGRKVLRKWANYRVLPNCDKFINNNHDAWDRPVLMKSYRTFIGAHNFVEHVQIEEQSKGRIIDAVARDIGESIYVDILIATNRNHANLINDIQNGRMGTMSMGCSVTETICTKCGNVAADETQMCEHIKYAKGNYEFDMQGRRYRIAELCGHDTIDPNGGVHFIEASWVAVPAFQGAVTRGIIEPAVLNVNTQEQVRNVLASPASVPTEWSTDDAMGKAARTVVGQMPPPPDPGGMPGGDPFGAPGGMPGAEPEKDPMDQMVEDVQQLVLDRVKKQLQDKFEEKDKSKEEESAAPEGELATSTNENINHQASVLKERQAQAWASAVRTILKVSNSDAGMINHLAQFNEKFGVKISREIYRTALHLGSTAGYDNLEAYLSVGRKVLGRQPTTGEAKTLVRLGQILSMRK
jgi:hypothetical protein